MLDVDGSWNLILVADVLLEKGEIKSEEVWDIYRKALRLPQVKQNIDVSYRR